MLPELTYDPAAFAELMAAADMPVYDALYEESPYDRLAPCPPVGLEYGDTVLELLHGEPEDLSLPTDVPVGEHYDELPVAADPALAGATQILALLDEPAVTA